MGSLILLSPLFLPHLNPIIGLIINSVALATSLLMRYFEKGTLSLSSVKLQFAALIALLSICLLILNLAPNRGLVAVVDFFRYAGIAIIFWGYYLGFSRALSNRYRSTWSNNPIQFFIGFMVFMTLTEMLVFWVLGWTEVAAIWKARENIGGIDSVHFGRMSGVFSYPGDYGVAAVVAIFFLWHSGSHDISKFHKISSTMVLSIGLIASQSRAAIAFFLFIYFCLLLRRAPVTGVLLGLVATVSAGVAYGFLAESVSRDLYIANIILDPEDVIRSSRRFAEWRFLFNHGLDGLLFGVDPRITPLFYEAELTSLVARLGLLGILAVITLISIPYLANRKALGYETINLWILWIGYVLVYCSMSAGFSRPKLLIVAALILASSNLPASRKDAA